MKFLCGLSHGRGGEISCKFKPGERLSRVNGIFPKLNYNIIVNTPHNSSCLHIQNAYSLLVAMSVWQTAVYAIFSVQYCQRPWRCLETRQNESYSMDNAFQMHLSSNICLYSFRSPSSNRICGFHPVSF